MNCFGRNAATREPVEVAFRETIESIAPDARNGGGLWIAPGWVDIQVNGYAGVDFNSPETEAGDVARALQALFATGVTRFYPTVITGAPESMLECLRRLARFREELEHGDAMDGFHVEGPHIGAEDGPRGAHPRRWVRPPDLEEFQRWQDAARGRIRIVTLSPEWPEAPRYIEAVVKQGVVAAIGHTAAAAGQIRDAVAAGATFSTHLGNGAHAVIRRHPNYIWDQMAEDRLMAGFIVDGIHLDSAFLKVALRAKGVERSVLVTDAATPAGAAPGRYRLGEQDVDLTHDGRVVLAGTEKLAGSALRMDRGIENLVRIAGLRFEDAVRMATVNPAVAGAMPGRTNGLAVGERADLVQFRRNEEKLEVVRTWMGGRLVFEARN